MTCASKSASSDAVAECAWLLQCLLVRSVVASIGLLCSSAFRKGKYRTAKRDKKLNKVERRKETEPTYRILKTEQDAKFFPSPQHEDVGKGWHNSMQFNLDTR